MFCFLCRNFCPASSDSSPDDVHSKTSLLRRANPAFSGIPDRFCPDCANLLSAFSDCCDKYDELCREISSRITTNLGQQPIQRCKKCGKTFENLCEHENRCHFVERKKFHCQQCDMKFVSKRNLRDHVNVKHDPLSERHKKFVCPECPNRFYKMNNLKSHLLTHSSDKPLTCPDCGCKFKRAKALKSHRESRHGSSKTKHLCSFCGKSFDSLSGMKLHAAKHTGDSYGKRLSECDECGKSFRCAADLKIHSVVHTKEKPFSCDICGASYTQRATLTDHYNVHLNTFQCGTCKKSFARKRYLNHHLKICPESKNANDEEAAAAVVLAQLTEHNNVQFNNPM